MKKKVYEKPSMREHKLQHHTHLLAGSETPAKPDVWEPDVWDDLIEDEEVGKGW